MTHATTRYIVFFRAYYYSLNKMLKINGVVIKHLHCNKHCEFILDGLML